MRDINSGAIVFNLSGGAILITVFAYMGFAFFHTDIVAPCTARYPAGKQFALDGQRGNLLTPIELQGRAGTREWGILKNAQILGSGAGSNDAVMQVSLASTDVDDETARNGVGFTWQPPSWQKRPRPACPIGYFCQPRSPLPNRVTCRASTPLPTSPNSMPRRHRTALLREWMGPGRRQRRRGSFSRRWYFVAKRDGRVGDHGRWALGPRGAGDRTQFERRRGRHIATLDRRKIADRKPLIGTQIGSSPGFSGVVADIGYAHTAGDPVTLKVSPFVVQWQ